MKKIIYLSFLVLPAGAFSANPFPDCVGNPHACADGGIPGPVGPQGPIGPQGPVGPQGPAGQDGIDGINGQDGVDGSDGKDGANGKDGINGRNGRDLAARAAVGVEGVIRIYDGKRITVEAFDAYDVRGNRNHFAGARLTLKLGTSYEERLIAKQQIRLAYLQNAVYLMDSDLTKLKRFAHHPYKGQHKVFDDESHSDEEPTETTHKTYGGTH